MKITMLPGGDYYLQKSRTFGSNSFEFSVRATEKETGTICWSHSAGCPEELVGKKLRFKVEVVDE